MPNIRTFRNINFSYSSFLFEWAHIWLLGLGVLGIAAQLTNKATVERLHEASRRMLFWR